MIVVDTNIISYLLIPNEKYNQSVTALYEKDTSWIAPSLWRYEFLSVLSLYQRKSIISPSNCEILYQKALEIVETRNLIRHSQIFKIIETSTLSAYDCSFVALAREMNLPLITYDKKILNEFPAISFHVEKYL